MHTFTGVHVFGLHASPRKLLYTTTSPLTAYPTTMLVLTTEEDVASGRPAHRPAGAVKKRENRLDANEDAQGSQPASNGLAMLHC